MNHEKIEFIMEQVINIYEIKMEHGCEHMIIDVKFPYCHHKGHDNRQRATATMQQCYSIKYMYEYFSENVVTNIYSNSVDI